MDFSIRTSPDYRLYTATRGLSQCPTSFIGIWRQGIHRKPLVVSPRDAENSILFPSFFTQTLQMSPTCYSLVNVLTNHLGWGLLAETGSKRQVQVGLSGIEPETSPLSEARSNQLS